MDVKSYVIVMAYAVLVYIIPINQGTLLSLISSTVLTMCTGCFQILLIMYFDSIPSTKQTILIYSTKLLIYSVFPTTIRNFLVNCLLFLAKDSLVGGFQNYFGVWCTIWNPMITFSPYQTAQALTVIWKIVLLANPVKFLSLNIKFYRTLFIAFILLPDMIIVINILIYNYVCPSKFVKEDVEELLGTHLDLDKTFLESIPIGLPGFPLILAFVLICELTTRIVISTKNKRRKLTTTGPKALPSVSFSVEQENRVVMSTDAVSQTINIHEASNNESPRSFSPNLSISQPAIPEEEIDQEVIHKVINKSMPAQNLSEKKSNQNSYSIVLLMLVVNLALPIGYLKVFIKSENIKRVITIIMVFTGRFLMYVIPLAWIITQAQVKVFVTHKLRQMKMKYF